LKPNQEPKPTLLELPSTSKTPSNPDPLDRTCPVPKITLNLIPSGSSSLLGDPPILSNPPLVQPQKQLPSSVLNCNPPSHGSVAFQSPQIIPQQGNALICNVPNGLPPIPENAFMSTVSFHCKFFIF
jgi:hypothetical protein